MPEENTNADLVFERAKADPVQPSQAHEATPDDVARQAGEGSSAQKEPASLASQPVKVAADPSAVAPATKIRVSRKAKPAALKPSAPTPVKAKRQPVPAKRRKAVSVPAGPSPAKKIAVAKVKAAPAQFSSSQLKDKIMATNYTDPKAAFADVQGKAKAAYAKGSEVFGELTEFTKGNVEAVVASGKILGSGLQELGTAYVADTKAAFETLTAEAKELAAVRSPLDFFKLQGEILRRNFDASLAFASKNSEALLKLTNEAAAPLSGRVSLAVEKVRKAA